LALNNAHKSNFLCKTSEMENLSCKSFQIKIGRKETDIFLVKKDEHVFAYQDICPHAQAPLEWNPDEFLDEKKESIICAMHGAKFTIETGDCISGPCKGAALTTVKIELIDGDIFYK